MQRLDTMSERFYTGAKVRVIRTVRNDGSFTNINKGGILIEAGQVGIVRTYGFFLQTQIIYQVYFPEVNRVIGIRDEELILASCEWIPQCFYSLDKAALTKTLVMKGKTIANRGQVVVIKNAIRNTKTGSLHYEVELCRLAFLLDANIFESLKTEIYDE